MQQKTSTTIIPVKPLHHFKQTNKTIQICQSGLKMKILPQLKSLINRQRKSKFFNNIGLIYFKINKRMFRLNKQIPSKLMKNYGSIVNKSKN